MKIGFILDNPINKIVYSWEEIKSYNADSDFSREFYLKCKTLELNEVFWSEIKKSRKKLGIPEYGIDKIEPLKEIEIFNKELVRLQKELIFDKQILESIDSLLYCNCVRSVMFITDEKEIDHRLDDQLGESDIPDSVLISIQTPVKFDKLRKYIKENWSEIEELISRLPNKKTLNISKRDLRIAELKINNPKMTYEKIGNQINDEFNLNDDLDKKMNEWSTKQAYQRLKEKSNSLVKRKK